MDLTAREFSQLRKVGNRVDSDIRLFRILWRSDRLEGPPRLQYARRARRVGRSSVGLQVVQSFVADNCGTWSLALLEACLAVVTCFFLIAAAGTGVDQLDPTGKFCLL